MGAEVGEERKPLFWTLSPLCCFGSLPSSRCLWHIAPQAPPGPSGRHTCQQWLRVSPYPGPRRLPALPAEGLGSHCMLPGLPSWQMGRVITLPLSHIRGNCENELMQSGLSEPLTDPAPGPAPEEGESTGQDLPRATPALPVATWSPRRVLPVPYSHILHFMGKSRFRECAGLAQGHWSRRWP